MVFRTPARKRGKEASSQKRQKERQKSIPPSRHSLRTEGERVIAFFEAKDVRKLDGS